VSHYDIAVIGLGVVGSACAAELAERGRRVLGVDKSPPDSQEGASGGATKLLREFHPGRPGLGRATAKARSAWLKRADQTGRSLFRRTGGLAVGPGDDPVWIGHVKEMTSASQAHQLAKGEAIAAVVPWAEVPANAVGIYESDAGVLLTDESIGALRDVALSGGAEFRFGVRAELDGRTEADTDRPVRIRVGDEVVSAGVVVFCVGAWASELSFADRVPRLRIERAVVHWATRSAGISQQNSPFVTFHLAEDQFCVVPWFAGSGLKFGRFSTGQTGAPCALRRGVRVAEREADKELLGRLVPMLHGIEEVVSRVCLYTHPPHGDFFLWYVGPRVLVVSACAGRGFKFAPLVAHAVADCVLMDSQHGNDILNIGRYR
jgi:glycine/D-amino acid oxidase-like deaminating enzyme